MFDSLKKKLQNIRTKFTSNIEEVAGAEPAPPVVEESPEEVRAAEPGPSRLAPPEPPAPREVVPEEVREKPTFFNKLKVLVREREVLLQEKDIEEPLCELEMVLLENDVALPVTDEIIGCAGTLWDGTERLAPPSTTWSRQPCGQRSAACWAKASTFAATSESTSGP